MKKILIIDDDEDVVEAMRFVLDKRGYKVITAGDGNKGLTHARAEKPDAVILDVMMPGLDGFEVARELKGDPQTKGIPILMLTAIKDKTGFDFQKDVNDPDWLPVEDYCNKPLDCEVLVEKIDRLLLK
ncbi:MAG TPA: response regulator [Candidatus Omnitrophota bacterium]|nr:response regulator [Candidatus Omnitrophota bacterium]